jgi:hypothetical protein
MSLGNALQSLENKPASLALGKPGHLARLVLVIPCGGRTLKIAAHFPISPDRNAI